MINRTYVRFFSFSVNISIILPFSIPFRKRKWYNGKW